LLAAVIGRDIAATLVAGIAAIVVLFAFMGLQLRVPANSEAAQSIIVATWNAHNEWHHAALAREAVDRIGADIVLTQEAIDNQFLSDFEGFECVRTRGQRIFIRQQPSLNPDAQKSVPDAPSPEVLSDGLILLADSWRPAHQVRVQFGDHNISLLDAHLVIREQYSKRTRLARHPRSYLRRSVQLRSHQIASIAHWAEEQQGPFIIAGDFNTPPHAFVWQPLAPLATDAFGARGRGFGYTYRRHLRLWRIDYIWVSPHFRVLRCGTFDAGLSDHLGVWAELEFAQ